METTHLRAGAAFNPTQRLIRIRKIRPNGLVEFDFGIGDTDLLVELILPQKAFDAFARHPGTRMLTAAEADRAHAREQAYLYGLPSGDAVATAPPSANPRA